MLIEGRPTLLTFQPNRTIKPTWYPIQGLITPQTDLSYRRGRWITGNNTLGYTFHAYTHPSQSPDMDRLLTTVNPRDPKYKQLPLQVTKKDGKLLMRLDQAIEQKLAELQEHRIGELTPNEEDELLIAPFYARSVIDYAALQNVTPANQADVRKRIPVSFTVPNELRRLLNAVRDKRPWHYLANREPGPPLPPVSNPHGVKTSINNVLMPARTLKRPAASASKPSAPPSIPEASGSKANPIDITLSPSASPVKKRSKHRDVAISEVHFQQDETQPTYTFHGKTVDQGKQQVRWHPKISQQPH